MFLLSFPWPTSSRGTMQRSIFVNGQSAQSKRQRLCHLKFPGDWLPIWMQEECQNNCILEIFSVLFKTVLSCCGSDQLVKAFVDIDLGTEGCRERGGELWARISMNCTIHRVGGLQREYKHSLKDSQIWILFRSILQANFQRKDSLQGNSWTDVLSSPSSFSSPHHHHHHS